MTFAKLGVADPAPFQLGEVYRFEMIRTTQGWRIGALTSTPVWSVNLPAGLAPASGN